MSDITITSTEPTPHDESGHELSPRIKAARARSGVLLFMLSDFMMLASMLAAGGWLSALNVLGMFKVDTDQPAFGPGLLAILVLVFSGLCYFVWQQGMRGSGKEGQTPFFLLALLLIIGALAMQIWVWLNLGYITPPDAFPAYDAFQSVVLLLTGFESVHLLVTSLVGILVLGRIMNGRLAGRDYIPQVVGYWWYYTVIAGVVMWLFIVLV